MNATSTIPGSCIRPLRILCADDDAILGDVMLSLFAKAGHWVEHVNDGLQAWERVSRDVGDFDVIVTDHQMPGLNGLELVELLRQANYTGRIVVHTSGLTSELAERYRAFGVQAFILKTSRADDLLNAVEEPN